MPTTRRSDRRKLTLQRIAAGVVVPAAWATVDLLTAGRAWAGDNVASYLKTNAMSLATSTNWSTGALPTVNNDAAFNTSYPTTSVNFVFSPNSPPTSDPSGGGGGGTFNFGSLNDLNTNGTVGFADNSTKPNDSNVLILGGAGGTNRLAPNGADILYVASKAILVVDQTYKAVSYGNFLSLSLGQAGNFDIVGTATINTVITSAAGSGIGFNKSGGGVLTLSGSNTYSGGTVVTAGELRVNNTAGSGTGTSAVIIGTTGTLGGSGTISNGLNTLIVNGTITAGPDGATTGKLTTGAQQWNFGGTFAVKVNQSSGTVADHDVLQLNGLSFGAGTGSQFNVSVSAISGTAAYGGTPIVLAIDTEANTSSPFYGSAAATTLGNLNLIANGLTAPDGKKFTLDVFHDDGTGYNELVLGVVAAPEPTSLALAAVAVVPLMLRRRRSMPMP